MPMGSCLCGEVAFEIDGEITAHHYCHCSRCRKRTGSAFQSSASCRESDFRWVKGEELIQVSRVPPISPAGGHHRFCSRCGCSVPFDLLNDQFWIPAGCLDDIALRFERHTFVGSKASWFEITDDLEQQFG